MWHRAILPPAPPSLELIQIREIWEYCEMSSVTPIQPSPLEIVEICKIWWQFSVFVFLPWFEYWIPYPDIFNHQIQIFVPDYEGYANPWDCTDNPCKWCETICRIRDAYKKKIAHILSHRDRGGGGGEGGQNQMVSKVPKISDFFVIASTKITNFTEISWRWVRGS